MNYYEKFKTIPSNRTPYFQYVLSLFNGQPINILELGTSRTLDDGWIGDGWSSFHWLEYIDKFGGKFITSDLEEQNIKNCFELLSSYPNFDKFKGRLNFLVGDALNILEDKSFYNDSVNLIYLDVGDCPKLTLDCFEKINLNKTTVFVDDFSSKGVLLAQKYHDYLEMTWPAPIGHKMALYKKNQIKARMIVEPIER